MARKQKKPAAPPKTMKEERDPRWDGFTADLAGVHVRYVIAYRKKNRRTFDRLRKAKRELVILAYEFVESLRAQARLELSNPETAAKIRVLTGAPRHEPLSEVKAAFWLYERAVRQVWGPFLLGFLDWVWSTLEPGQIAVFLKRDIGAAYYLATRDRPMGQDVREIYLSRDMMALYDEWTHVKSQIAPDRAHWYLNHNKINRDFADKIVVIDTGTWGSILARLYDKAFGKLRIQARFINSQNPYIPGYLNYHGVPARNARLIMDSLELIFPQRYGPVTKLQAGGVPMPYLVRNGQTSQYLYDATSHALNICKRPRLQSKANMPVWEGTPVANCESDEGFEALQLLLHDIHSRQQRMLSGTAWRGVLHRSTPPSQRVNPDTGLVDLIENYPEGLRDVNPAHLLPGGYGPDRRTVDLKRLFGA